MQSLQRRAIFLFVAILLPYFQYAQDSTAVESEAFKISDISAAIEETSNAIQMASSKVKSSEALESVLNRFNDIKEESAVMYADTSLEYWSGLNLSALENVRKKWNAYKDEINKIDVQLTDFNHLLDDYLEVIDSYEEKWKLTREVARKDSVQIVEERIQSMIDELENLRTEHKGINTLSYQILDSITQEKLRVNRVLSNLKVVYDGKRELLFVQDSPEFFDMISMHDSVSIAGQIYHTWSNSRKENLEFLRKNKVKVYLHIFIFILLFLLFRYVKKELDKMDKGDNYMLLFDSQVLKYPLALAFLFALTISFWYYNDRPAYLSEQIIFLIIVPATWILFGFIRKDYRMAMIVVAGLYLILQIQQMLNGQELAKRWLLMVMSALGLIFSLYLSRPKSGIYQRMKYAPGLIRLFPLVPVFMAIAVYANYKGSVGLSQLIVTAVIRGSAAGIVLFLFISVIQGLIEFLMASPLQNVIHLFSKRRDEIIRWSKLILRFWAGYTWVMLMLKLVRLQDGLLDSWNEFLAYGWEFGEVSLTVELIINFALIIIIFSVVANVTKALLEIEILPRLNLKKGIPMAIAVVTRYIILTLGFFMATAAAGISLDKLGFLAGALGVGIGFGLQNVVGNFVSGLILVFERPIHIDDVIVTENIEGVVKEVGIRASKIRSWDGAEVIVPNMDLVSRQVTNWTLSDTHRRREIMLKLEYGSDPNKVIEIVQEVLEKNEDVLKDPNPMVLFLGYQQYSIDFRVLFWLSGNMLQGTSDVTLAIFNALKKEGIEVAVPRQRMIWEEGKNDALKKRKSTGRGKSTPNSPSKPESNKPDESTPKT